MKDGASSSIRVSEKCLIGHANASESSSLKKKMAATSAECSGGTSLLRSKKLLQSRHPPLPATAQSIHFSTSNSISLSSFAPRFLIFIASMPQSSLISSLPPKSRRVGFSARCLASSIAS